MQERAAVPGEAGDGAVSAASGPVGEANRFGTRIITRRAPRPKGWTKSWPRTSPAFPVVGVGFANRYETLIFAATVSANSRSTVSRQNEYAR